MIPRDDRITLVSVDDLDSRFHGETVMDMNSAATLVGVATADKLKQDERHPCKRRGGWRTGSDSTEILREARERHAAESWTCAQRVEPARYRRVRPVTVVVDANIAVKWVAEELDSAEAVSLYRDWSERAELLIAPPIFRPEVTNVLHQKIRRGELGLGTAIEAIEAIC